MTRQHSPCYPSGLTEGPLFDCPYQVTIRNTLEFQHIMPSVVLKSYASPLIVMLVIFLAFIVCAFLSKPIEHDPIESPIKSSSWELPRRLQVYASKDTKNLISQLSLADKQLFLNQVNYIEKIIESTRRKEINSTKLAFRIACASIAINYDPLFVASVVFSESSFRQDARSPFGALGLMQIMPTTGEYIAKKRNIDWKGNSALTEPAYNLELGLAYLQYLNEKFDGNTSHTLQAYNWGPSNVNAVLYRKSKPVPSSVEHYSNKIQKNYQDWRNDFEQQYTYPADLGHFG